MCAIVERGYAIADDRQEEGSFGELCDGGEGEGEREENAERETMGKADESHVRCGCGSRRGEIVFGLKATH